MLKRDTAGERKGISKHEIPAADMQPKQETRERHRVIVSEYQALTPPPPLPSVKAHSCAGDLGARQAGHQGVSCRPVSWCSWIGLKADQRSFSPRAGQTDSFPPQLTIEASGAAERPVCPLHHCDNCWTRTWEWFGFSLWPSPHGGRRLRSCTWRILYIWTNDIVWCVSPLRVYSSILYRWQCMKENIIEWIEYNKVMNNTNNNFTIKSNFDFNHLNVGFSQDLISFFCYCVER